MSYYDINDSDDMINYALSLVDLGLSIIPLKPNDKIPLPGISWKDFQTRKPTYNEIKSWFLQNPSANIGVVCGKVSNLVVLDLDSQELIEKYKDLIEDTKTLKVQTGKGMHLYFKHPGHATFHSHKMHFDIQGEGAYVVMPPSKHPNGRVYEWMNGMDIIEDELLPLPDWVQQLLDFAEKDEVKTEDWFKDIISGVTEGQRINSLTELIGYLFGKGLDKNIVLELAKLWNQQNNPPIKVSELNKTVNSIYERHLKNPEDIKSELEQIAIFKHYIGDKLDENVKQDIIDIFVHKKINKFNQEKVEIDISDALQKINEEFNSQIITIKKILTPDEPYYEFHCIDGRNSNFEELYVFSLTAQELISFRPFQAGLLNAGYVVPGKKKSWLEYVNLMMDVAIIEKIDSEETFEGTIGVYLKEFFDEFGWFLGGFGDAEHDLDQVKCFGQGQIYWIDIDEFLNFCMYKHEQKLQRTEVVKAFKKLGIKRDKVDGFQKDNNGTRGKTSKSMWKIRFKDLESFKASLPSELLENNKKVE
jgi:hypothetical protein